MFKRKGFVGSIGKKPADKSISPEHLVPILPRSNTASESNPPKQFSDLANSNSSNVDADALADMRAYSTLREKRKAAKRKKIITFSIAGVVILGLLVGGSLWFAQSMEGESLDSLHVQTAFVERGTFLDSVMASGKLKPISSVSATPEVDGLVGEVFVAEGDTVTAGQNLYTVVNAELDKAVAQAQQDINDASNGVEVALIAVNDAYHAKSVGIAAAQEMPTEEGAQAPAPFDVSQADSAIRQAELSLASAQSTLAAAQATYDDAVATAGKRTVVSPIDGSVVSVNIEPGKALGGANAPATPVQIANLSQMVISVEVNEIDILKISVDQAAAITFSAIPDLELEGKVTHIATVNTGSDEETVGVNPGGTVTYTVSILIETPDPRLKPGMTGKASIVSQRLDDVLMVPLSAVMMISETEGTVLVVDPENPEEFTEQSVEILASDGLMLAVKGRVTKGDELMIVGDGMIGDPGMTAEDSSVSSGSTSVMVG